ncbi:substrate-binding domain-containing protein [Paludibacterium purpuratum]|nr:substrate-binding domain-containing protein [Paludibacterium purpuratum]
MLWLAVAVLCLSGCPSGERSRHTVSATVQTVGETPTVGLAISNIGNPFFKILKQGAEQGARECGLRLQVVDARDNTETQQAEIKALIAQKVRVLLVNPTDSQRLVGSVAAANRAGIPVITLDRSVDAGNVVAHISSDNMAGGRMAGEYIKHRLGGKGRVVELLGVRGASSTIERDQGFAMVLNGAKGLHLLARESANFDRAKAEAMMAKIIARYGEIDAVFALNDEMALGAERALRAAGQNRTLIVGFDASAEGLAAIRAGKMAATIAQRPDLIGHQAVLAACRVLDKAPVETYIPIPLELVNI